MSPKEKELLYKKHIEEANIYLDFIKGGFYVLDIGSGTGFPGIPLAILKPEAEFILIDRRRIHADFVDEVIKQLGLKNAKMINMRAENLCKLDIKFDIVCARAVSRAANILKWSLPIVKIGGLVIMGKGKNLDKEISDCSVLPYKLVEKIEMAFGYLLIFKNINWFKFQFFSFVHDNINFIYFFTVFVSKRK